MHERELDPTPVLVPNKRLRVADKESRTVVIMDRKDGNAWGRLLKGVCPLDYLLAFLESLESH